MPKNIRDKSKNYIKTLLILLGFSFALVILLVVSIKDNALAAGINLSVSPATSTVVNGQTFTANIVLDTAGVNIDGVDVYSLHYNPAILQIQDANNSLAGVQITPGTLLPLTLANSVNTSNGTMQFSQVTAGGSTFAGAGVLASISFKAIANGTSAITIDFSPTGGIADSNVAGGGIDKLGSVTNASYTVTAPPISSTKFSIGNTVQTTTTVNVRQTASATGTLLGTQTTGVQGTVVAGPTYADGFHWWQVNYNSGVDGWSAEDFLVKVTTPTPTPAGTVNVSTLTQLQNAINSLTSVQTISIAAGTYNLINSLYIPQNISNVTIKGATGNRDTVIIKGPGMNNSAVAFGFWADNINGLTFADMTIRDINQHAIIANGGVDNVIYRNLRIVDIGDQFLKNNPG